MYLADWVARAVAFVRTGYPTGMPATGYVPLVALLRRRVSDDEITTITSKLRTRRRGSISNTDVGVEITRVTDEMPSPQDIERVQCGFGAIGRAHG